MFSKSFCVSASVCVVCVCSVCVVCVYCVVCVMSTCSCEVAMFDRMFSKSFCVSAREDWVWDSEDWLAARED